MTSTSRRYGSYEIRRRLGGGAMGEVFLAWDPRMGRSVALKVLGKERARDRTFVDRFVREARAAGSLEHQNVVGVYDWGTVQGEFYIAMQYVDGSDLDHVLYARDEQGVRRPRFRPLPIQVALAMARDISLGLEHLHEHGVIHRDLKPANVMLSHTGVVKITDFGLARRVDDSIHVTIGPHSLGTPSHMSPEAAAGRGDLDARADLFSMGVLAFELFSSQVPFEGDNIPAVLFAIQTQEPPELRTLNPLVPEPVAVIVHRMLAKEREKRCASAREARLVFDRALADLGVLSTADLLREFVEQPRSLVERLYVGSREEHLNRGAFLERQGTGHIQEAVDSYSLVLYIDPAHAEARSRFDRLVRESAGGTRTLPLQVPRVPPPAEQATWVVAPGGPPVPSAAAAQASPQEVPFGALGPDASVGAGPLIAKTAADEGRRHLGRRLAAGFVGVLVVAVVAAVAWRLWPVGHEERAPDRAPPTRAATVAPEAPGIPVPVGGAAVGPPPDTVARLPAQQPTSRKDDVKDARDAVRPGPRVPDLRAKGRADGTRRVAAVAAPVAVSRPDSQRLTPPSPPIVTKAVTPTVVATPAVVAAPGAIRQPADTRPGSLRVQKGGLIWGIIYLDNLSTGEEPPFIFNHLEPRRYTVSVRREGYSSPEGDLSVPVRAGETTTVRVTLLRNTRP